MNMTANHRVCLLVLASAALLLLAYSENAQAGEVRCGSVEAQPSDWTRIKPAVRPVEAMFANREVWVGLGHVTLKRQIVRNRTVAFVPWIVPKLLNTFDGAHALDEVNNPMPTLYIHWKNSFESPRSSDLGTIHLVRLRTLGEERAVQIIHGHMSFTLMPGFDPRADIRIRKTLLSDTIVEVQVDQPLMNGEYMLFLEPSASSGFEFSESCGIR